jgi:hypothetical protein
MRFIKYCDKNRILLAIFPAHSTHTLQPLDVAIFGPLSTNYTKQLRAFINDSQGLTRLTKRDFFRLFWPTWEATFTTENILKAFRTTGLYPFNPDYVIHRFTTKKESRPSSSEPTASAIRAEDWRRIRKLVREAVSDEFDQKAQQLNNTLQSLSTQNILLTNELRGIKNALMHAKKRQTKKKPLLLDLPAEENDGALFMSPSKVQQARDLVLQKDEAAAQEKAHKDDKKLQQELAKQAKEMEKAERAQIRKEKREQRLQEAAEKQRLKDEQALAKLANLQLQNNVVATPNASKRSQKQIPKPALPKPSLEAHSEDNGVVVTTNRRGRAIRPPARFRD